MQEQIRSNWDDTFERPGVGRDQVHDSADGQITDVTVEQTERLFANDQRGAASPAVDRANPAAAERISESRRSPCI